MGNVDEAFVRLYNETYDGVLKYVLLKCGNPHDAPDIVQKTYLNYYERLKKDGGIKKPESYLFIIAQNEIKKYYRFKSARKNDVPLFSGGEENPDFEKLEAFLSQDCPQHSSIDVQEIWRFVRERDDLTFKIFVLYFYYGEKLADIAKILDIGESAVKNRLYRTIKQMREHFNM